MSEVRQSGRLRMRIEFRKQEMEAMVVSRFQAVLRSSEYAAPDLAIEDVLADLLSRMDWSDDSDDFPTTAEVDRAILAYVRMAVDQYSKSIERRNRSQFTLDEIMKLRDRIVEIVSEVGELRPGTRGIVKGFGMSTQGESVLHLDELVVIIEFCVRGPRHRHVDVAFSKSEFETSLRVLDSGQAHQV